MFPAMRILVAIVLALSIPSPARAGADTRGGWGHHYVQVAYSDTRADEGFDVEGERALLASDAFLDRFTSLLASNGAFRQESFRVYAELGLLEDLDLLFSLEWKRIEETFTFGIPGLSATVTRANEGVADGMVGFAWRFLADPVPVAADLRLVFPNYPTDAASLNLDEISALGDKVPLGKGTYDLALGLGASTGSLIPYGFGDLHLGYELADLEERDFSDRVTWEVKAGGGHGGLGGALFATGAISLSNGPAPDEPTRELIVAPDERVIVLDDQEWTKLGAQVWYDLHGLGIQLSFTQTVAGTNTTRGREVSVALSFRR